MGPVPRVMGLLPWWHTLAYSGSEGGQQGSTCSFSCLQVWCKPSSVLGCLRPRTCQTEYWGYSIPYAELRTNHEPFLGTCLLFCCHWRMPRAPFSHFVNVREQHWHSELSYKLVESLEATSSGCSTEMMTLTSLWTQSWKLWKTWTLRCPTSWQVHSWHWICHIFLPNVVDWLLAMACCMPLVPDILTKAAVKT